MFGSCFGCVLFPHGIAERADLFSQCEISAVGIADGLAAIQVEFPSLVEIFFTDADGNHFCKEHMMAAQRNDFFYLTLNVDWAFQYDGAVDLFPFFGSQVHFSEFVHISAASDAAEITGISQVFGDQIVRFP